MRGRRVEGEALGVRGARRASGVVRLVRAGG